MRARPFIWIALGVVTLVGVIAFWQLTRSSVKPPAGVTTPNSGVAARANAAPRTNAVTVAESTAPGFLTGESETAGKTRKGLLAHRLSNTTKSVGQLLRDDRAVILENALIDTGSPLNFSIPGHLRSPAEPGSYIVQARGPVDDAFRASLAAAGATIVSYIPNNAYLVRATAESADQLRANTRAVLPYEPVYKLKAELLELGLAQSALPAGSRLNIMAFADGRAEVLAGLQQRGLTVLGETRSPFGPVFTVQMTEGADWVNLALLPAVEILELVAPRESANDLSRVLLGVAGDTQTTTNYLNLSGSNVLVVVNDTGVSADHPDLVSRVFPTVPALGSDASGHGTHVAGIIAGDGAQSLTVTNAKGSVNPGTNGQYRGVAPGARLYVQSYLDSDQSLQEGAARTNALISNNSWNYAANTYGIAAASYDAAVRDSLAGVTGSQPVLYVFAAGNSGGGNNSGLSGSPETIRSPGTAKNVITVGATELARDITNEVTKITGTTTNKTTPWKAMTSSSSEVASFSSRGNVGIGVEGDFGRFKPDVVAPGTFVVSTRSTTWDERAYYNPTSHSVVTFENQVISSNAVHNYSLFLPANAVGFSITLLPNQSSPTPFPDLPIFVRRDDIPNPPSTADFIKTNVVVVPPDGGGVGASVGQNWFYSIANVTTQEVSFNIITDVTTTNDLGDYYEVLSNLNNSISGNAPYYYRYESGTSMAAGQASGTLALMQEFFQQMLPTRITNSPALLKALLINGARSADSLYDFQVQNSINYQGWGLINLANSLPGALTNYTSGLNTVSNSMLLFDQSPATALATGQSHTRTLSVNENGQGLPLRVTLVWTDPPGNPAAGVKLVNDLDLVVTNLDTGEVFFGNDIPVNSTFTFPWETNAVQNFDAVNNVENVFIAPALGSNYTVTVHARRVNVNAVTAHTNNVVQDYALVISSGNGEVPDALHLENPGTVAFSPAYPYPQVTAITNQFPGNATVGGGILLGQHVGANTPLLGTTNGMTNQWHFYVITNTVSFTNAGFVTFLPPTLSLPREGVFTDLENSTRPEADIDLYVSQDFNLTNLSPAAIAAADKSRLRGGTEFIVYTNSNLGDVYYVGVKSEDYMAAEYAIFAGFSLLPFTQGDGFGNWIVNGFPLPSTIEDGSPEDPGGSLVLGLSVQPAIVRRLIVTNSFYHENQGDLIATLSHDQKFVVLNNHRSAPAGQYTYIYEDNDEEPGNPVLRHPDGPGKLRDFVGDQAVGVWLLTTVDNSLSQTGVVNGLRILIEPSDTSGSTNRVRANSFFFDVVDVPVGATNLEVCVDLVSPNALPIELYVRYEEFPTRLAYDYFRIINPPGACLNITPADLPPLRPGRYYIGLFNPNGVDQDVVLRATVSVDPRGVVPINWSGAGNQPVLDDAVNSYSRFVTNRSQIAQVEVGLRIDHPRVSDLAVTLISPQGTRVLLAENRGGTDPNGFGSTMTVTNFVPVASNGGAAPQTNYVDTGATVGTVTINYDFFDVPDQLTVYYENQAVPILDSGMISGAGRFTVSYGPGSSTVLEFRMNEFGNTNATTLWQYSVSSVSVVHSFLTFTENTNLTTTPIKFAPPPFQPAPPLPPVMISDFEFSAPFNTASGTYFGPRTGMPDGWNVLTTDPVTVASNPPPANTGVQSLVLRSGQILRNLPTAPGRSYRLDYAYRQVPNLESIVGWWPGEQLYLDVVGTNNGVPQGGTTFGAGEVGYGFLFNGATARIVVPDAPTLRLTNALTVEAWVNPRSYSGFARGILQKWGGVLDQRNYSFDINPDGRGYIIVSSDGGFVNVLQLFGTSTVTLNQWTHLAATYDGTTLRYFVNGRLENSAAWTQGMFAGTSPVIIGAAFGNTTNSVMSHFDGQIDEATIYNRALTPTEIAGIYAAGASGKFGLMFPPDDALVSTNYPYRRSPVGAQIYVPGQLTNSFLGDTNWQTGGIIFTAGGNTTPLGLSPVVTGNHFYQFIRTNITWQDARATAATLSTNGLSAHLVTITSAEENEFIRVNFATNLVNEFAWIGGREPVSNGVWHWDVGPEANLPFSINATPTPPFNYANWGTGEPSNSRTNEDYLMFNLGTALGGINNGQWADAVPTNSPADPVVGFLVEFEPIPPIQSGVMVDSFMLQEVPMPRYVLPEESLDVLRGQNAYGLWQLEIWDSRTGATNQVSLLDWQLQFVFITNTAAARRLTPCSPVTTMIPPGTIAYYTVDVPGPARFATNLLFNASGPVGFYFNQVVPPEIGAAGPGDVVFATGVQNWEEILTPASSPPLLPGQRYYLGVENLSLSNVSYTLQVCYDLAVIPPSVSLTNGVEYCAVNPSPLSLDYYRYTVSSNAVRAQFEIYNLSGDMSLFLRRQLPPTFAVFDYFSANPFTNSEVITVFDFSQPVALSPGDWYLAAANLSPGPVSYCAKITEWPVYGTNIVITNVFLASNSFCLTWTSLPGVHYRVEGITNLTSTNWTTVSPTLTAVDYSTTYCVPLPSPFQFFRVVEGLAVNPYAPPPVIARIESVLQGILITWGGPVGARYQVEWSPSLTPATWTTIPTVITSQTGVFQYLDDGTQTAPLGPMRYYRLQLLP